MAYYPTLKQPVLRPPLEPKLRPPIRVMDQALVSLGLPCVQRLLLSIEEEIGLHRAADAPAHNAPGKDVDDERHVLPALPG